MIFEGRPSRLERVEKNRESEPNPECPISKNRQRMVRYFMGPKLRLRRITFFNQF
jgi:hypothetical protein